MPTQRNRWNIPPHSIIPRPMAVKTNQPANEPHPTMPETMRRCLIAAHSIRVEADRLVYCFKLRSPETPLTPTINVSLEIIDKRMAYLTDVMAMIPTQPKESTP